MAYLTKLFLYPHVGDMSKMLIKTFGIKFASLFRTITNLKK